MKTKFLMIWIALAAILLSSNLSAQNHGHSHNHHNHNHRSDNKEASIYGHVINRQTGEHIPFLYISLQGTTIGTTT